jgi:magnesium transporter
MRTPEFEETEQLKERLPRLIQSGDLEGLWSALAEMHPSDIADVVESLVDEEDRLVVMQALPTEVASETLVEMEEEEHPEDLLAALTPEQGAEILHELEDDEAADLIGDLDPDEQDRILAALPQDEAVEIRDLLLYDEESAGGIMTTALVSIPLGYAAAEALREVREQGREVNDFYSIFVVDDWNRLVGTIPLDHLVLAEPDELLDDLIEPVLASVLPDTDQEEVGRLMGHYNLVSLPVVNEEGVLLGRITFDDVIDVLEEEQTEDILKLAGVPDEEELRSGWADTIRVRLPWLALNLFTASGAASVVYIFESTIEAAVILAVIMPVVAAMGGNAGTQSLAVTIRRIALSHGMRGQRLQTVGKELLVGMVNGLALGAVAALLAVALRSDPILGAVVFLSLWGNLMVAGFFGAFVPTILDRFGIDPAVASSVFVHTITDFFGFFLLLGLASALLL